MVLGHVHVASDRALPFVAHMQPDASDCEELVYTHTRVELKHAKSKRFFRAHTPSVQFEQSAVAPVPGWGEQQSGVGRWIGKRSEHGAGVQWLSKFAAGTRVIQAPQKTAVQALMPTLTGVGF